MLLMLYVFASFGLAFVLGYAKITLPLRNGLYHLASSTLPGDYSSQNPPVYRYHGSLRWAARWTLSLLECPACVAFWLGLASVLTPIVDVIPVGGIPGWVLGPILGFANTGAVLALGMITGLIKTE